jgi:hypothetical protein
MTTVQQPYTVNPHTGDIIVHGREGLFLELQFKDALGSPRDVSAASLFFEVDEIVRVALVAGSGNDKRAVSLTRAQVASLTGEVRKFALIDETETLPDVIWQGSISLSGYTAQPA